MVEVSAHLFIQSISTIKKKKKGKKKVMSHRLTSQELSYAGVEVVAAIETVVGGASMLSTGCGVEVFGLVRPRF